MRQIDPKYHIDGNEIVKTSNGVAVPVDEPLMLFRGRDKLALAMLGCYRQLSIDEGCSEYHLAGINARIEAFRRFRDEHPELMKQPGITRGL